MIILRATIAILFVDLSISSKLGGRIDQKPKGGLAQAVADQPQKDKFLQQNIDTLFLATIDLNSPTADFKVIQA